MKILMIGTWRPEEAKVYETQAKQIGQILAERSHTLMASPSSGIQGLVAKYYKQSGGEHFIGYYPRIALMQKIGEEALIEPDEKVFTEEDYSIRNILQVRDSEGVIAIEGGVGTLTELLSAVKDYKMPLSYFSGSSELIDKYLKIDSRIEADVFSSQDIEKMISHLENKYELLSAD